MIGTQRSADDRNRRCRAIGARRADRPHAGRNLSFGKLACRLIGGAGSGTVGIEGGNHAHRDPTTRSLQAGSLEQGSLDRPEAPTKAAQIYKKTGNLRAVQLLLGHTKLESTVRYLGIEVDDALSISEQVEL